MTTWIFRKCDKSRPLGFVVGLSLECARVAMDELEYDPNEMEVRRCGGFEFVDGAEIEETADTRWERAVPADKAWTVGIGLAHRATL